MAAWIWSVGHACGGPAPLVVAGLGDARPAHGRGPTMTSPAPLPPGSALLCLPLLHQALGSTREELGGTSAHTKREGTQSSWGRLRAGGALPARPAGCTDSVRIGVPIGPSGA